MFDKRTDGKHASYEGTSPGVPPQHRGALQHRRTGVLPRPREKGIARHSRATLAVPDMESGRGHLVMAKTTEVIEDERAADKRSHGGGGLERVTVNLTARSSQALQVAVELTGDTKTDTINRALQIYAFLQQAIAQGGSIHVRESTGAEVERLKIL